MPEAFCVSHERLEFRQWSMSVEEPFHLCEKLFRREWLLKEVGTHWQEPFEVFKIRTRPTFRGCAADEQNCSIRARFVNP